MNEYTIKATWAGRELDSAVANSLEEAISLVKGDEEVEGMQYRLSQGRYDQGEGIYKIPVNVLAVDVLRDKMIVRSWNLRK